MRNKSTSIPKFFQLAATVIIITLIVLTIECGAASGQVDNVIKKYHFTRIGHMYSDSQNYLLLVRTEDKQWAFWNPVTDAISPLEKQCQQVDRDGNMPSTCVNSLGLRSVGAIVTLRYLKTMPKKPFNADTSFSGGDIFADSTNEGNAKWGPNFMDYFTVEFKNNLTQKFYMIQKRTKPSHYEDPAYCDGDWCNRHRKIDQKFDTVTGLSSLNIGDGRTLLFDPDNPYGYPILLVVTSIPKDVWSSDGNVFIIPAEILLPKLHEATSTNLVARYKAVLDVIDKSAQAHAE